MPARPWGSSGWRWRRPCCWPSMPAFSFTFTRPSHKGWPLLPLVLVLQIMFVCGVSWPLSLANLVLRDIQQILTFLCTALMIVSPIAYAPDAAPGLLKLLVYLNPVSYFVLTCQSLAVTGSLTPTQIVLI